MDAVVFVAVGEALGKDRGKGVSAVDLDDVLAAGVEREGPVLAAACVKTKTGVAHWSGRGEGPAC